jgi:Cu/Ag efflux protein CusF
MQRELMGDCGMWRLLTVALVLIGAATPLVALGQDAGEHAAHHVVQGDMPSPSALADGEVRKVDKEAGKITLKHGPIANLDMPSMSMVFRVKDPAMLDQVKPGDTVKFAAEKIGGQYTVTRIERVE